MRYGKTEFLEFPTTPESAPQNNYDVANKKYVDDNAGDMNNPMTAAGDVIYGGESGTPTRLAVGTENQYLRVNNSGALEYSRIKSKRYEKGNISGAVTINANDGDVQNCTATDTVTGITISNLAVGESIVLIIDNDAEKSITFGLTEIIKTTDTGVYACAFYNNDGIVFMGKGEVQS